MSKAGGGVGFGGGGAGITGWHGSSAGVCILGDVPKTNVEVSDALKMVNLPEGGVGDVLIPRVAYISPLYI